MLINPCFYKIHTIGKLKAKTSGYPASNIDLLQNEARISSQTFDITHRGISQNDL